MEIRTHGAAKVVERIFASPEETAALLGGIRSGDREWLKVGRDLLAGADGAAAYAINLAFGDALGSSAARVLGMAPELNITCGEIDEPFIESLEEALAEVGRREEAVRKVSDPALTKQKVRCLQALAHLRGALPKGYRK